MESVHCVLNTLECPGRVWSSPMKVSVSSGMVESKYRYTVLHCIGHREQLGLLWLRNHNSDKSHMFTHNSSTCRRRHGGLEKTSRRSVDDLPHSHGTGVQDQEAKTKESSAFGPGIEQAAC